MKSTRRLSVLISVFALCGLASCGGIADANGTATVDSATASGNCCLNAQVASMLGATEDLTLTVKDGKYTLVKRFHSKDAASADYSTMTFDTSYTFTGEVSAYTDGTYTLAPATGCSYVINWGSLGTLYEGATPTENGSGTEADDATSLNWFYTPYLKDNKENTKSMDVTIKDGTLDFGDDFPLVEAEEE